MANNTRKTRGAKKESVRFRFASAADAKAVEERLNVRSTIDVARTGRTITVASTGVKALDRAADSEGVFGEEVGQRGRPKAGETVVHRTVGRAPKKTRATKAAEKPARATKKAKAEKPAVKKTRTKKQSFVVLCPASTDARKLAKLLDDAKAKGARVTITGSDEAAVRSAVKKAARSLEIPVAYEDGFASKRKPQLDKSDRFTKLDKLPKTELGRRPKSKKVPKNIKAKGEQTKPVVVLNVVSSTINRAWYNLKTHNLTIEFKSGAKYRYADVSFKEFAAFATADSQGHWFTENIKEEKSFKKLESK